MHRPLSMAAKLIKQNIKFTRIIMSSPKKQIKRDEMSEAVKEYLKKGGKITKCEPFARTENLVVGQWGRKNAKKKIENPTDE